MFGNEHSADRSCFDRAEEKAGERERQQFIQVMPVNRRQFEGRNSLRPRANQLHATCFECEHRCSDDGTYDNEKRDWFVWEKDFSKNEKPKRDPSNQKRGRICFAKVLEEEACVCPKTSMSAVKAEKLW